MTPLFYASYVILWLFVLILLCLLLLLYRQYGRMFMSNRERINLGGLDVGSKMPLLRQPDIDEGTIEWDLTSAPDEVGSFVMFATGTCAICSHLKEEDEFLSLPARLPGVRFLWVDSDPDNIQDSALAGWQRFSSRSYAAFKKLDVPATPFAYVCDKSGVIRGKGLINHGEEAEELILSRLAEKSRTALILTGRNDSDH